MDYVFAVTLPIYLGIALGYLAVRLDWLEPADVRTLGKYTVRVGVPALLFKSISHQSLGAVFNPDYLAVYALGSLASMALVMLFATRVLRRPFALAALEGLGASGSNSMFLGYPIAVQVIGPVAGLALALCALVENLLVIPLGLALADAQGGEGGARLGPMLRANLVNLSRNPMIVAMVAGLMVSASGLQMPEVLDKFVAMTASATSPVALFVIGGSLVGLRLSGIRSDIALIVLGKLVLHPLCVLVLVLVFPPANLLLGTAAVLFAAVPMMSIYPVLAQRHGHERLCSAALLVATVMSFATIGLYLAWMPAHWLPPH
ncbi:permease [Rhodoferax lacus]|uniref:Permease n=1 Tax=Rhodoferax lacus TaxID=2184758 RepID=A0A3E1RF77_9BURK|nr:AEC family transporter [Rhodoferax lacus]RFO97250.1 permease [Rhodoferax lacus]